jgi:hypothetical protein
MNMHLTRGLAAAAELNFSDTSWWRRSALVLVVAVGLCGSAMGQTVGTISGTGSVILDGSGNATSWSFNGGFTFDSSLTTAMGDQGQFRFQANSSGVSIVDGNGIGGATHSVGTDPWQIINTNATNPNSTIYGPNATFSVLGNGSVTGTLTTDGYIHWYYGYDAEASAGPYGTPGKTPLASLGAGSVLTFNGTPTNYNATNGTFDFTGTVTAVPEPETYAMLLAGLGLLGYVGRRRQRKEAAAA